MPDAISGQRGHDRTFNLACEIYRFGLDGADARAVFDWINNHKTGGEPWREDQIAHKLADAKARVLADGEFGSRLNEKRPNPFRDRITSALQRQARGHRRSARPTVTISPLRCGASK